MIKFMCDHFKRRTDEYRTFSRHFNLHGTSQALPGERDELVRALQPVENPHLVAVAYFIASQIAGHDGTLHAVVPLRDDRVDFRGYPGMVIFSAEVI